MHISRRYQPLNLRFRAELISSKYIQGEEYGMLEEAIKQYILSHDTDPRRILTLKTDTDGDISWQMVIVEGEIQYAEGMPDIEAIIVEAASEHPIDLERSGVTITYPFVHGRDPLHMPPSVTPLPVIN